MAEEKEFKIKPQLKSGVEEVDLYIFELHEYIKSFETSSIKKMLVAIDNVAQKIVDDLVLIAEGDTDSLSILSDDKESKVFDKISKIVEKVESWKKVSDMSEAMRPEVEEIKSQEDAKVNIDIHSNIFEQLQEQHYKKNKSK